MLDILYGGDAGFGDVAGIPGWGSYTPGIPTGTSSAAAPDYRSTLTALANSAETALRVNLGNFQAGSISADNALSNAWTLLNDMVAAMIGYGAQGVKSAAERDRRIDPSQLRWDWIAYYIDPIGGGVAASQPLPTTVTGALSGGVGTGGYYPVTTGTSFTIPWWFIAAIGAVVLIAVMKK